MFKLAHLTDIHLGPLPVPSFKDLLSKRAIGYANWKRSRHAIHRSVVLAAITEHMLLQEPDHIAVTGDLVNIALPAEFENARDWLKTLGPNDQVSVVPGNHDAYVKSNFEDTIGLFSAYFSNDDGQGQRPKEPFPFVRRRGSVSLIGLSSACPKPPFLATGTLGQWQIHRLEDLLESEANRGQFRIVLIHHPPFMKGTKHHKRLTDHPDFQRAIKKAGAELILFGHNHKATINWIDGPSSMVPAIGGGSASMTAPEGNNEIGGYGIFEITSNQDVLYHRFTYRSGEIIAVMPPTPLRDQDQTTISDLLHAVSHN